MRKKEPIHPDKNEILILKKEKTLIVGSGAREHALSRSIFKSGHSQELFCVGSNYNPGITSLCSDFIIDDINNTKTVASYAKQIGCSLAIIGPENPLGEGVSDALSSLGIRVVGPTKSLAQIETSKSFARNLLAEYNIEGNPTYRTFNSMNGVRRCLDMFGNDFVVKYDGLAGGKGVRVSGEHFKSKEEAILHCQTLVSMGSEFVIEEKLIGEEFSLMSFCDGNTLRHMPAVQDHKRAYENDTGPNTGGMGTYSDRDHSLPFLNQEDIEKAQMINEKTAEALKHKFRQNYKGILYGGFMCTSNGIKLIEYNARFGDPEAMNVLSILDSDLVEIFSAITTEKLHQVDVRFLNKATVCKYAVPKGYPASPLKGKKIDVSSVVDPDGLFFASVDTKNRTLIETGSRTVAFVGIANSITEAEKIAESEICRVQGPLFHRKDIGTKKLVQKRIKNMESLR